MNINKEKMEEIMRLVIKEVDNAIKEGNSPFAAFLLDNDGNVLYKSHNTSNTDTDPN